MKLATDSLIGIIEILRRALTEGEDVSDLLKALDLELDAEGKLALSLNNPAWIRPSGS